MSDGKRSSGFLSLLRSWGIIAVGVLLATFLVPGIEFEGSIFTLILIVVVFSLFNMVLRPLLILFTLPFVIITMGLGIVLINALLLFWTAELVGPGFDVEGFWAAVFGSIIISLTTFIANALLGGGGGGGKGKVVVRRHRINTGRGRRRNDDVIDV